MTAAPAVDPDRDAAPEGGGLRILLCVRPYSGHLHSIVPLAHALVGAGHRLVVATADTLAATVLAAGLAWMPAGLDASDVYDLYEPDPDDHHDDPDWGVFAIGTKVGDLVELMLGAFRPDLILRESTDLAATIAGEVVGVPWVTYGITNFITHDMWVGEGLDRNLPEIRTAWGLAPDRELEALYRGRYLAVVPPAMDVDPLPTGDVQRLGYRPWDGAEGAPEPPWLAGLDGRRTVLVTLGTVFNRRLDLFRDWVGALAADGLDVVCTLGADQDPDELGEVPANVRVERYLPHSLVLPHCAAMVCHTGFNTTMGALCAGVPVVAIPLGSDQEHNAERCEQLGLGVRLEEDDATAAAVVAAVRQVIDDPAYRERVAAFAADLDALPSLGEVVAALEAAAVPGRPQWASGAPA